MERLVVMRTNQISNGQRRGRRGRHHQGRHRGGGAAEARGHRRIAAHAGGAQLRAPVAASEATTILLEGENGTGKDLVAKTLHYQSLRQAEPFIAINCAAIPETLLESELFGYEKGAFTDARAQKRGIFELADKGTLFLDEIGEIPLMLQAKLLRVLEEQSFRRLGGSRTSTRPARGRRHQQEPARGGEGRRLPAGPLLPAQRHPDLIPPLRERPEDIVPLAHFFIEHYNRKFRRNIEGVTDGAAEAAAGARLAGQCARTPQRHRARHDSGGVRADHARPACRSPSRVRRPWRRCMPAAIAARFPTEGLSLEDNERSCWPRALEKTSGNQTQAARLLRITRDTLRYKMKKFNLR